MKPARFDYHAPEELTEVIGLLAEPDARIIAGGQSLVPLMNFRIASPASLVDLRRVEQLHRVEVDDSGELVIGAGATQSRVLADPRVARHWPLLTQALRRVGHPQIRHRGTVCGSLAHHDPSAELPAVALALGARLVVEGGDGRREVAAEDFFVSYYETSLRPGELVTEVRFPPGSPGERHRFTEVARKHGDFALVGAAAVARHAPSGAIEDLRLVLLGVADKARAFPEIGRRLIDEQPADPAQIVNEVQNMIDPMDDNRASAAYRRQVAGELAVEAVQSVWRRDDQSA